MLQVRQGRQAACRLNAREPLSRYAQLRSSWRIERLEGFDTPGANWIDWMIVDRRSSVADQVAARMDIRAWLITLSRRVGKIARELGAWLLDDGSGPQEQTFSVEN